MRTTWAILGVLTGLGAGVAGCSGGSSSGGSAVAGVTSGTSAATSGAAPTSSGAAPVQTQSLPSAAGPIDPAQTITVVAGGFSPSGASSAAEYGVDDLSDIITRLAGLAGLPTSATNPTAPNQITEVAYYGSIPPAYYSAEDLAEVEAAPRGAPRYALIVAKHIRHVLARSQARHVNLAGASFGGVITRTLIERDLEGLASEGRIVRWLTLEGTAGGVWVASEVAGNSALAALADMLIEDPSDVATMSYDYVRATFGVDTPNHSVSPFFSQIQVGFQVSTDHDMNQQALRIATNRPNDGVLLVEDQALTLAARPQGPAVVLTDSTHDTARTHEGLAVDVINFLRSSRRARVRLVEVEVRDTDEPALLGRSELALSAELVSPAAAQEFGVTTPVASLQRSLGTAPFLRTDVPQTVALDETLYDWQVAPTEAVLILTLRAEELDLIAYYDVIEDPTDAAQDVAELTFELPVAALGTQTVSMQTAALRAVVEVEVFEDLPR